MGEKLNRLLEKPLFVYLFGFFFLIYRSSTFFASFQFHIFLIFLGIYSGITCLAILIAKKIGLSKYIIGWIIFAWCTLLFKDFIFEIAVNPFSINLRVSQLIYILFFLCILFFFIKRNQSILFTKKINQILNIFLSFLIVLTCLSGFKTNKLEKLHQSYIDDKSRPSINMTTNRDIIWILLDEYAAPACLKSQFHFHDWLVDSLQNKGFFVFDSLPSRYDATLLSINSLFNLDDSMPVSNSTYSAHYLKQSKWVYQLEQAGYSFISLDFLPIYSNPSFHTLPFYSDNYFNQIIQNTAIPIIWFKLSGSIDIYNLELIQSLKKLIQKANNRPVFIWAHLLIPHFPSYRDEYGIMNNKIIFNASISKPEAVKNAYKGYLFYGNNIVLDILNKIPNWKNKTIIISGDHGARMFLSPKDPRRFATFAAIYYTGMEKTELKHIKYLQQIPFYLH